jgi:hypothetical protein
VTPAPIVVSHSEIDAIRQCGHKADLAYRAHWVPARVGAALSLGRLYHEVMAEHYRAVQAGSSDLARRRAVAEMLLQASGVNADEADLCAWMYDGYEERWGTDPQWEIIAVEDQRLIRLPNAAGRGSRFWLRMRADLLVRERLHAVGGTAGAAKIHVVDHKSGRNLPNERELDLDDQFGLYTWGYRRQGIDVFASLYNAARTQRNKVEHQPLDERFSRTRLYRTGRELETIAREAYQTVRAHYQRPSGVAPRAPDTSPIGPHRCTAKCPFTEPCLLGRKAGPRAEQDFLASGGYRQLTDDEHLVERGYAAPLQP